MKVNSIRIKNYRSIDEISFTLDSNDDKSFTYGLIGVNEAGKSSILKALSLKDNLIQVNQKDFRDKLLPIEITYNLSASDSEKNNYFSFLNEQEPPILFKEIYLDKICLNISFHYSEPNKQILGLTLKDEVTEGLGTVIDLLTPKIIAEVPKSIFWTAEDKYLISQPINLTDFASNPEAISVPLRNCFSLADISNIPERIGILNDSTEKEALQTELGEKVTEHIKTIWPNHPITITFLISDGLIHFHVKDSNSKAKAKTADQRSDGFKQFVSFLLTISAQSKNEELKDAILLLDEPETHLHPQAQEFLLNELINITKNKKNNIVFFATHSNHMIDKIDLSRNYCIRKNEDKTEKESFSKKVSSYASVNYEVYNIPTNDFHNELYGAIQEREQKFSEKEFEEYLVQNKIKKDKPYTKIRKGQKEEKYDVTLPTKIRNIIHHPENTKNKFSLIDLRSSIELLLRLRDESSVETNDE